MSFQTITTAERDAGSPVTEELLGKYWERDDSLRWRNLGYVQQSTNYVRVSNPETWTLFVAPTFIPRWAKAIKWRVSIDGNWSSTPSTASVTIGFLGGTGFVRTPQQNVHQWEGCSRVDAISDRVSALWALATLDVSGALTQNIRLDSIDAMWATDESVEDEYLVGLS